MRWDFTLSRVVRVGGTGSWLMTGAICVPPPRLATTTTPPACWSACATRSQRETEAIRAEATFALVARLTAEVGSGTVPSSIPLRLYANLERSNAANYLAQSQFLTVERADLHVLDGMLRLERGQPSEARAEFGRALLLYEQPQEAAIPTGRQLARHYLEVMNRK